MFNLLPLTLTTSHSPKDVQSCFPTQELTITARQPSNAASQISRNASHFITLSAHKMLSSMSKQSSPISFQHATTIKDGTCSIIRLQRCNSGTKQNNRETCMVGSYKCLKITVENTHHTNTQH